MRFCVLLDVPGPALRCVNAITGNSRERTGSDWGSRGRRFKSCQPDHMKLTVMLDTVGLRSLRRSHERTAAVSEAALGEIVSRGVV